MYVSELPWPNDIIAQDLIFITRETRATFPTYTRGLYKDSVGGDAQSSPQSTSQGAGAMYTLVLVSSSVPPPHLPQQPFASNHSSQC